MIRGLRLLGLMSCLVAITTPVCAQKSATDKLIDSRLVHVKMYSEDYAGYDALGAAYLQKGRETGDADYYELAKNALSKSLDLCSDGPAAASAMTHMAIAYMAEH